MMLPPNTPKGRILRMKDRLYVIKNYYSHHSHYNLDDVWTGNTRRMYLMFYTIYTIRHEMFENSIIDKDFLDNKIKYVRSLTTNLNKKYMKKSTEVYI